MTFLAHPTVPPDAGGVSPPPNSGWASMAVPTRPRCMLHLRPDLVDMAWRPQCARVDWPRTATFDSVARVSFGWLSDDFGADGHIGDPTVADAALGARLFEGAVAGSSRRSARSPRSSSDAEMAGRAPHELRVDADRFWRRIEELGEIGAVIGPNGERGVNRLALSDDDRAGRDLVVSWMRDLGMAVADRCDRQRRRHDGGPRSRARPGDDRLAYRHRAHRRPVRRQSRRARRARGHRGHHARTASYRSARSRSLSSPTRRAPDSPRTCSARWSTWADWRSKTRSTPARPTAPG